LKQEVKKLELEVEKQRIKSASIKEKIQFARNQLQTINEQKEQFDNLVKQKKVSFLIQNKNPSLTHPHKHTLSLFLSPTLK
jgi:hypothetical protein